VCCFELFLDGPYGGVKYWYITIHGPACRGANGVAIPTDEDDKDGQLFFDHPEREGYFAA